MFTSEQVKLKLVAKGLKDSLSFPLFLVIIYGSYKPYDLNVASDERKKLEDLRDFLREDVGVNAFIAIDCQVPLDLVNAIRQSQQYAEVSNACLFILTKEGDKLGVGIELGNVIYHCVKSGIDIDKKGMVFVERGIGSAMLEAIPAEYEVAIKQFEDLEHLKELSKKFVLYLMRWVS